MRSPEQRATGRRMYEKTPAPGGSGGTRVVPGTPRWVKPWARVELPCIGSNEVGHGRDQDGRSDLQNVGDAGAPGILQTPAELFFQLVEVEQGMAGAGESCRGDDIAALFKPAAEGLTREARFRICPSGGKAGRFQWSLWRSNFLTMHVAPREGIVPGAGVPLESQANAPAVPPLHPIFCIR